MLLFCDCLLVFKTVSCVCVPGWPPVHCVLRMTLVSDPVPLSLSITEFFFCNLFCGSKDPLCVMDKHCT